MLKVQRSRFQIGLLMLAVLPLGIESLAEDAGAVDDIYKTSVRPFLEQYCVACHNDTQAKGELDLTRYARSRDVAASFRSWNNIIEFIRDGEMPPEDAQQPSPAERAAVVAQIRAILLAEAIKSAGDPGVVLPRRLSNTEYDRSIRDLTGVDIRPTQDFPADPAGGEGFDNTGEALGMSPNLLKKYLSAADLVSQHLVLKTGGIAFAPYPVTSYNARKKLTEQAIIDFYEQHAVDTLVYLEAAWRYRYREPDQSALSIEQWAERRGLSAKYLALVWKTLEEAASHGDLLADLGRAWDAVPAPRDASTRPAELLALRDFVEHAQQALFGPEPQLIRANAGNWPISHLDFRAQIAATRNAFNADTLQKETVLQLAHISAPEAKLETLRPLSVFVRIEPWIPGSVEYVVLKRPVFSKSDRMPRSPDEEKQHEVQSLRQVLEATDPSLVKALGFGEHPAGAALEPESLVVSAPATIEIPLTVDMQRKMDGKHLLISCELDLEHSQHDGVTVQYSIGEAPPAEKLGRGARLLMDRDGAAARQLTAAATVFCKTFPNRFVYVDRGRGLAAGFHLVEGFFRDDQPLVDKVLDPQQNAALDQLWQELEFVTQSAETLLRGFVWFERSEREVLHDKRFDFLRSEDPQLVENHLLDKFEKLYLDKMGIKRHGDTLEPEMSDAKYAMIHGFFQQIRQGLAKHRKLLDHAEQQGLADLVDLARRADGRAISPDERQSLHSLYAQLRDDGQDVEQALRGVLTAVLMSPDFCYRYSSPPEGPDIYPLSDDELAERLSYFLWSSVPDQSLLDAAAAGELQSVDELLRQTRRMLQDDRISGFAREFFGQWLRYRDYLSKDPIDAAAFPGYDDALREAIADEPVRLVTHLIQADRPITDLLNSDTTFVNRVLAKHYGGELERQYLLQRSQSEAALQARRSPRTDQPDGAWYPVTGLRQAGRGGLFGMAVVLATNSAGQRTSPVKRGFWSVHHLLGQHFPPPPADVPELPATERGAERTIRELLAAHVADPQCAMCHKHFDALGVAMEGFDAIGRSRTTDLAGRPIDHVARLPGGESAAGIPGLIDYIESHRRGDFVRTMCRKFLGYALGRSVALSDQPLLDELELALAQDDYRFSALFEAVVRSPQFRKQRGRDFGMVKERTAD